MPLMTGRPTTEPMASLPFPPSSDADTATPGSVAKDESVVKEPRPTKAQRAWLRRGLDQPGGKLPLFDRNGRRVSARMVRACLDAGWAEPWFANPLKPDWQVCKLTENGRRVAGDGG